MTKGDRERLRAELAGKAMQAIISNKEMLMAVTQVAKTENMSVSLSVARSSVLQADALLAELDRTAEDPIKAGGTE